MDTARVTIVQLECDADDPTKHLARMEEEVRAHAASDLIVFPELALHGHEHIASHEERARGLRGATEAMVQRLDGLAASFRTRLVYGACVEQEGRLHNIATYTDGRERVSYAKTHVHWSEGFAPGDELPVVRSFPRPLGMLICFDAAFAEVPRVLALRGAEIIVNISAIPEEFPLKHVHRRLVACSVQNQVFTLFANRAGDGFRGGSAVVDPQGEMLAVAGERGPLSVDLDLDAVRRWREEEPLFAHRRPGIYGDIALRRPDPRYD